MRDGEEIKGDGEVVKRDGEDGAGSGAEVLG